MNHPFCKQENPEQNEALSLVVTHKKKRHKVTDTRITPRTVSRILGGQEGMGMSPASMEHSQCTSPRPPPYPHHHQPPPMLPVSLPTSVAIPNPGLHESQVFSPYSPFFHGPSHGHHMAMQVSRKYSIIPKIVFNVFLHIFSFGTIKLILYYTRRLLFPLPLTVQIISVIIIATDH